MNLFAVNPYSVFCLLVSPATSLNSWLLPLLNSALAIFPLSSLILISNELTSDAYTYTSFLSGAGSEYLISTVGGTAGAAGVAGAAGATGAAGWAASFSTITFTGPSTFEPSEYVTTAVAVFSPGVAVFTGVLNSAFVPAGRSLKLAIEFSAFGCSLTLTV